MTCNTAILAASVLTLHGEDALVNNHFFGRGCPATLVIEGVATCSIALGQAIVKAAIVFEHDGGIEVWLHRH